MLQRRQGHRHASTERRLITALPSLQHSSEDYHCVAQPTALPPNNPVRLALREPAQLGRTHVISNCQAVCTHHVLLR